MTPLLRTLLPLILAVSLAVPAGAAPPPRPFSGHGIVIIRPLSPARAPDQPGLPLYREPGVARFATVTPTLLPSLAPVLKPIPGESRATVVDKRGKWLHIIYDEAGRTGWISLERSWDFFPWGEYLSGRWVKILPGMRKNLLLLRQQPEENSPAGTPLTSAMPLRVISVSGDWCMVLTTTGTFGWIRWRDGDGRFVVSIEQSTAP